MRSGTSFAKHALGVMAFVVLTFASSAPSFAVSLYKFSFTGSSGPYTASGYLEFDASDFGGNPSHLTMADAVDFFFTATYPGSGSETWSFDDVRSVAQVNFGYSSGIPFVQSSQNGNLAVNPGGFGISVNCCRALGYDFPGGGVQLNGTWETALVDVNPTPLPAALPLFASVIGGGLGLVRWRRRRLAAA